MVEKARHQLTVSNYFLQPSNSTHRQYEALRAFFVESLPSAEVAARFGYTPGSFRVLVHQFRTSPREVSSHSCRRGGHPASRNGCGNRSSPCASRTSLSMISAALAGDGEPLSPAAVAAILKEEGFAKLPRRGDDERPDQPAPVVADIADVR